MIFVINGKPGCGKDTFANMCVDLLPGKVLNISTVDYVKAVATTLGWSGVKTPENRKFLSDLKKVLTEWEDIPYKKVCDQIFMHPKAQVVFIHCREPEEIQKFVDRIGAYTLLIQRPTVISEHQINDSDNNVDNYNYDFTINNNGSIDDLKEQAREFLRQFLFNV